MPNKYSHGLVFSQQQQRWAINNYPSPSSLRPPTHTRSADSSISSLSGYSAQNAVIADYIRLEPAIEPDPSSAWRSSAQTARLSVNSAPSDSSHGESTPSQRPRPPSDRLRLESPTRFRIDKSPTRSRIEELPSPPPRLEYGRPERPGYELSPSRYPDVESSSQDRIRLVDPSPQATRHPRPTYHHKNSSVETQIYDPKKPTSPSPTQEDQDLFSLEALQSHSSPSVKHEHQHVYSTGSPKVSRPPKSTGDRPERLSPEMRRTHLPSPTQDPRQSTSQKTHPPASLQAVQASLSNYRSGADKSTLSPSAQDFQDYFSLEKHGSRSASTAQADRQKSARSHLPTPSQNGRDRPSMDIQRMQPPSQTQIHRYQTQSQAALQSGHGRRQSIDSQRGLGPQDSPSLGPRRFSFDQSIKDTLHSRGASINSRNAREHQSRPLNSQQLSWEQFVHESENMREPLIDSQTYSSQMPSSYSSRPNSRQSSLADAQRYTPKNTSTGQTPQSRRDRRSKLPDTFTPHHRTLPPTGQENVSIETHGIPPERPPSPPATPDSGKSFSLATQAAESQKTKPSSPNPQRSASRSLSQQRPTSRSANSSVVELPPEPTRPKTSSAVDDPTISRKIAGLHSPTFSISTRNSSLNATRSAPSVAFSNFSDTMTSPRRLPSSQSNEKAFFDDADLTPLPSEIDFAVLPYENPNVGPAIFRPNQLGLESPTSPRDEAPTVRPTVIRATQLGIPASYEPPDLSRASSFDSAAPPPIGLNRNPSHATAKTQQPKTPKKEGKTSLLSFLRPSPSPKAVLYSEASQGKPPASVSVSRTGMPSIPGLFPGYRGQFPPSQKTRATSSKSSKSSLEPRSSTSRSSAHRDAADKRTSWLKGDDLDKMERAIRLEKKREFERILKAI